VTFERAYAAYVALLLLASCKPHEGGACLAGPPRCDGARALVCIDHRWVAQRCKSGCAVVSAKLRCELVDDPQPGEACFDPRLDESLGGSPVARTCSSDKKSIMTCTPNDGRWTEEPCGAGGECVVDACKYTISKSGQ